MKSVASLLSLPVSAFLAWTAVSSTTMLNPEPLAPSSPAPASTLRATPRLAPQSSTASTWTTGAHGILSDPNYGAGNHVIDLRNATTDPMSGMYYDATKWVVVLDYSAFTVQAGAVIKFVNHPSGAPVVIQSPGPIIVAGTINLDGAPGQPPNEATYHSEPGPGGFRGGYGDAGTNPASAGNGPGAGFIPNSNDHSGASGSYAAVGGADGGYQGDVYGSLGIAPLIGGSGGCGAMWYGVGGGGGAGGGALLLGSNQSITISGFISAKGGGQGANYGSSGSGGAIRLASPFVDFQGATLNAQAGATGHYQGSNGRIRIETASGMPTGTFTSNPGPSTATLSDFLPASVATLTILGWYDTANGQWVAINQDPTTNPSTAEQLPSTGSVTLRIEGHGVPLGTTLKVRTTYSLGNAVAVSAVVGTTSGVPPPGATWTDVSVNFSLGVSTVQVRTLP